MVRSKAPTRYITQLGVPCWSDDGVLGGGLGGCGLNVGSSTVGDDDSSAGDDSVVKALTALQSLCVSGLIALTFQ